jgi:hypothetical protein
MFSNGDLYDGEFKQGFMNGQGRYFNSFDGSVVDGVL